MRYLIYEPDAIDSVNRDLSTLAKTSAAPWRRCPTEESAAQVVRSRYPDAMPGPYETTDDVGRRLPVLLVWETARALADGADPVLIVEPELEVRADEKQLKRYRKGDRGAAPFDQKIWTRGAVPEPRTVIIEREASARFTGFIGEIDTTVRAGVTTDGRSGLWFDVQGFGPFSVAVPEPYEISLRHRDDPGAVTMPNSNSVTIPLAVAGELGIFNKLRDMGYRVEGAPCREYPVDAVFKTIGPEAVRCHVCGSTSCWDGYLRWEIRSDIDLNKSEHSLELCLQADEEGQRRGVFHELFRRRDLAANVDFVRRYRSDEDDDTMRIMTAAEADYTARGITFDQYMGKKRAYGSSLLDWYANGDPPEPRPGMVALMHPQLHKRDWETFAVSLTTLARALKRWLWVCECEETRWFMAMVGDPPPGPECEDASEHVAWSRHVRPGDQYIAVISPEGEWKVLGAS